MELSIPIRKQATSFKLTHTKRFAQFHKRIQQELLQHRVITHNPFCQWFEEGNATPLQVKAFVVQFSVFSNLFLMAQLKKMINADSIEGMRASKEILANEIGVVFHQAHKAKVKQKIRNKDKEGDPELVSTEGTIEGGLFHFRAAHFEWLLRICEKLNLKFTEVGKRRHGTPATLFFCDELSRLYGHEDYRISSAASYAVENWAAAGFWKQLICGFEIFKKKHCPGLPLAFFTWHDRLEDQHALHTQEELEEYFFEHPDLDQNLFIQSGNEMMEGVWTFWEGLDEQRKSLEKKSLKLG
ncbi:MAG: hypothetical protein HY390_05750 [Deltaproteobacteria bacterium]|nr:hypothetical protein [Deltaproteobacteria bacterium]